MNQMRGPKTFSIHTFPRTEIVFAVKTANVRGLIPFGPQTCSRPKTLFSNRVPHRNLLNSILWPTFQCDITHSNAYITSTINPIYKQNREHILILTLSNRKPPFFSDKLDRNHYLFSQVSSENSRIFIRSGQNHHPISLFPSENTLISLFTSRTPRALHIFK